MSRGAVLSGMRRCVVISAGEIRDYARARDLLREDDFFVFCDGGLAHADGLCVKPDLIVGDFDSCNSDVLLNWQDCCEVIQLPREKDDTDTLYAVKLAVERLPVFRIQIPGLVRPGVADEEGAGA